MTDRTDEGREQIAELVVQWEALWEALKDTDGKERIGRVAVQRQHWRSAWRSSRGLHPHADEVEDARRWLKERKSLS